MRRYVITVALVGATVALSGCDENVSTLAGPTPDLRPTFASVQAEVFEKTDSAGRLACVNCHTTVNRPPPGLPAGRLNLTHDAAYAQLVNVPSTQRPTMMRVVPGNPDASYIIHKIEPRTDRRLLLRMPFLPPYLGDGQITILRRWIEIGAPQ
jgi:hypothetical protein